MRRRTYLSLVGSAAAAGTAGCLGVLGGDDTPTVLPEPDHEYDASALPYPAWGERVPDATVPAALGDATVSTQETETPALYTFFYSHCQTVCPVLVSTLRNIQTHAANNGYADDIALRPVTFDPERDTADRLASYGEQMHVDTDADNWTFLRPAGVDRAKAVVTDDFGVTFKRTHPEGMDQYMFSHAALTVLVNADGYVERAYRSKSPDEQQLIADLETVRQA
ncbi:SCO family protein [Halobacterium salinarum]|uniref:SCO family protein n=1 Tax=Halobacterium salinarum TaxID=2242 RepID=UPI002552A9BF|nr:SCO family protein [Halobacterium salinarum]MDL0120249.1 SCO family protein [Halobacterium salinarum]